MNNNKFCISKLTRPDDAYTNKVYINTERLQSISTGNEKTQYVLIKDMVYTVEGDDRLNYVSIALNVAQRETCKVQLNEYVQIKPYIQPSKGFNCDVVNMSVSPYVKNDEKIIINDEELEKNAKSAFFSQILTKNQITILKWTDQQALKLTTTSIYLHGADTTGGVISNVNRGIITPKTQFIFESSDEQRVYVKTSKIMQRSLFTDSFKFENLGIGGLDNELADIFRRAFSSRVFPPSIISELGISHVKGMLLYGPPGTGKTLIARQIGKALRAREPKIVNGPEILNKYVGQSEENIRNLFKEAEDEFKRSGDHSSLHIIIFDEIDAICKHRGAQSVTTGVNDSIVNQLLAKIDGVNSLNNILLIGMTNRRDLIDEALLRPGRLEVHVEIGLPDEEGRLQILNIHTSKMRESKRLDNSVNIKLLATQTKNFSGAEIEGLVRNAASYAFHRKVDFTNLSKPTDADSITVTENDFDKALGDIKPAYGAEANEFDRCLENGIIEYSNGFLHMLQTCNLLTEQIKEGGNTRVLSLLLHGQPGTGKTAVAAYIAKKANFPFMKFVSPENFIGMSEAFQIATIAKVFDDAYKSQLSLIVLDDIERLLGYTPIGPRFSNNMLQTLLTLLKKAPPKPSRRLLIIATTSEHQFTLESGISANCTISIDVLPIMKSSDFQNIINEECKRRSIEVDIVMEDFCNQLALSAIPIKKVLIALEVAAQASKPDPITDFNLLTAFIDCGISLN